MSRRRNFLSATLAVVAAGACAFAIGPVQAGMFGPGKFEILQADGRFDESGNVVLTSRNNRISKRSIVGGTHLDANGVYINPTVRKDANGTTVELGLVILNKTGYDTTYGAPNTLGIIREIAFAPEGGNPIVLAVTNGDYQWSETVGYNPVSRSASAAIEESGFAPLTLVQYQTIVAAKSLAARIVGSKRSVTYENAELAPSFVANLRKFADKANIR